MNVSFILITFIHIFMIGDSYSTTYGYGFFKNYLATDTTKEKSNTEQKSYVIQKLSTFGEEKPIAEQKSNVEQKSYVIQKLSTVAGEKSIAEQKSNVEQKLSTTTEEKSNAEKKLSTTTEEKSNAEKKLSTVADEESLLFVPKGDNLSLMKDVNILTSLIKKKLLAIIYKYKSPSTFTKNKMPNFADGNKKSPLSTNYY